MEEYETFEIFWYHWPKDGFAPEEDYEPVIILYKDGNKICCIITRRHWDYRTVGSEDGLVIPPQVLFDGIFHPPFVKTSDNNEFDFDATIKNKNLIHTRYEPKAIKATDIPKKFRTGDGHFTKPPWRKIEDPVAHARYVHRKYCK